jgi:hypothetical protein
MGFAQLYYTSCEHGLSGYAGYQFNAATPGVDPRVLREVERFTVYEPPRSAPPERVDEHPVNLCYAPDVGGAAVLSRVVSSGDDPSGRPGNYFAHSLVATEDPEGGPLPAELWGAGFWAAAPVTAPDLPTLHVTSGPLDRTRSEAWVRRWPPELVARLLAAADAAIDDGLPVLVVADSADVAHWVAALTHLLPPRRARALSFATYSAAPDDAFVHVVGVPRGSDTTGWRGRFTVFDSGSDSAGDLPVPEPEAGAVADLLARRGPAGAAVLWEEVGPYASGREASLADWRPVVAAAALLDGRSGSREGGAGPERDTAPGSGTRDDSAGAGSGTWDGSTGSRTREESAGARSGTREESAGARSGAWDDSAVAGSGTSPKSGPRSVREWLPRAVDWLSSDTTSALVTAILDRDADRMDDEALAALQRVAHQVGSDAVTERLEGMMVRRSLDRIASGEAAPPVARMRSESVRATARAHITALLEGEHGDVAAARAVELLRWARAGGLVPSSVSLERYGGRVVAARLADTPAGAGPDPALETLVSAHDEIRRGAAARLAGLPRARLADLAAGPVGALFADGRDGSAAVLRELRRLRTDRRENPARLLADVVGIRVEGRAAGAPGIAGHDLDAALLADVWGVDHGPGDALLTLRTVRSRVRADAGVGDWVTEALVTVPAGREGRDWRELVAELDGHWLGDALPGAGRRVVDDWSAVAAALRDLRGVPDAEGPDRLAPVYGAVAEAHPTVREMAYRAVADTLMRWRQAEPLAVALCRCPDEVFDGYCDRTVRTLREHADAERAALVFLVAGDGALRAQGSTRADRLTGQVLAPIVGAWSRRHVAPVRNILPKALHDDFDAWARDQRDHQRGERGFLSRLTGWGGGRRT